MTKTSTAQLAKTRAANLAVGDVWRHTRNSPAMRVRWITQQGIHLHIGVTILHDGGEWIVDTAANKVVMREVAS